MTWVVPFCIVATIMCLGVLIYDLYKGVSQARTRQRELDKFLASQREHDD